jgi:hypothetical protein
MVWECCDCTLHLDHSLPCAFQHGARHRALPFPCVLSGARQRGCDAVSSRTAVNTFSLPCVAYYARQPTVPCVAFSQNARQSSLPGKNEPGALCHALWEKEHGKGGAVRFRPFAVRCRRTAKSAIPVVLGRRPVQRKAALWIRRVPLRRGGGEARRGRHGRRRSARQARAHERARLGLAKVQAWGKNGRRRSQCNRRRRGTLRVRAYVLPEGQRRKPGSELRSWATQGLAARRVSVRVRCRVTACVCFQGAHGTSLTALLGGDTRGCARTAGMPVLVTAHGRTRSGTVGCVRVDEGRDTYKKQSFPAWLNGRHHQHKRGGAVACRDMAASARGSTCDHGSKTGRHKRGEGLGAHQRPKGPRR